jgi:ribosomal protein S18 acetylase RimI-like enzyme
MYEIRRVSQLEDVDAMLEVEEQAFATNPIHQAVMECITTDENRAIQRALGRTRLLNALEGRADKSIDFRLGKAVYIPSGSATGENAVAFVGFDAPVVEGTTSKSEPHPSLPVWEDLPDENKKALKILRKLNADLTGKKSEELMGSDRKTHYWYLSSLATMPAHQQRGLATRLVQWVIDLARADAKARPGKIKGVWTIATPNGLKTYLKAGMKEIGSEVIDYGKGLGENGQKYVWLLMRFDD